MKIIFVSSGLKDSYGGPPLSESHLVAQLQAKHEISVWCRADRLDRDFVRRQGIHSCQTYTPLAVFKEWLKGEGSFSDAVRSSDVVHINGHWFWEHILISRLCKKVGVPYVLHPRGMYVVRHRKVFLKHIYNRLLGFSLVENASKVVALSRFETGDFVPYPLAPSQVVIIPNGVTAPQIPPSLPRSGFLYLGRIEARKNLLFLLQGFKKYRDQGGSFSLRLMGPAERGFDSVVKKEIERLGLNQQVTMESPQYGQAKWTALCSASAVIYPCVDEPFGRVPFEALLAGAIPVVPIESGSAEYLNRWISETVFSIRDSSALAKSLHRAEKMPEPAKSELIRQSRQWIEETLNWRSVAESVEKIYEQLKLERTIASAVYSNLSTGGFIKESGN